MARKSSAQPIQGSNDVTTGSEDYGEALFRRMANGDESALAALYDRWGARVHTVAFCILLDADEAEDVVEETFWQAWRHATRYDGQRATGASWLLVIARSRAIDRLRALRRRADRTTTASRINGWLEKAPAGRLELPGIQAERTERYSALAAALQALPDEQREAVEMAYFQGLTHPEIAGATGQPVGTVKTRIRLAMGKLRQRLEALRDDQ